MSRQSTRRSDPSHHKKSPLQAKVPARSRRYSDEEHARALVLIVGGMTREKVAESVGCTTESLRRWYKEALAAGALPKPPGERSSPSLPVAAPSVEAPQVAAAPSLSSAPKDPGSGLGEHETRTILDYKESHPSMGPAQIRAQLKRFMGWRVSVKAIARVLKKAGYRPVHRGGRPVGDEHPGKFEAPHRNSLWQLDFTELRVGAERRYLLVVEDDFSRFIVGHRLCEGPTSEVVVEVMREAIGLHGKPERVYTDRGAAFTAWRDVTACETFLDAELIDHSLRGAHRPQGGGKIESVMDTVKRELWEVVEFSTVKEATQALGAFFCDYNHRRAHTGIASLVPADRFYGRWPEVVAEMDAFSRRRQGAQALTQDRRLFVEPPPAAERALVLQLVLCGDQAELHFLGRRIRLGSVEQ